MNLQNHDRRIFFFDLDGTLLSSDKIITPATMQALERFTAAGNHFVINTGRALDSAMSVYCELGLHFPGSFLASFNGSEIYDCDKQEIFYRTGVPMDLVSSVFNLAAKHGIHCHTYNEPVTKHLPLRASSADSDCSILSPDNEACMQYYRRVVKVPLQVITPEVQADGSTEDIGTAMCRALDQEPCKIIAIELEDHEKQEAFRRELETMAQGRLQIMYSNPYYLEIFPVEAGKGAAVRRLCEHLNIPVEHSLAAGDEHNDISMIEAAGTGIAMLNATEDTKAVADVITKRDNDHDGLLDWILAESQLPLHAGMQGDS